MDGRVVSDRTDAITLRQWAVDAQTAFDNWPTMTAGQKDATTRETIRRLGVMAAKMADFLDRNTFSD